MSTEIIVTEWNQEKIKLFKQTLGKELTDLEAELAVSIARRTNLDPIRKQIYFIKRGGRMMTQVSIEGFRTIAQRTGKFGGRISTEWCGTDGLWKDVWLDREPPRAAKVSVQNTDHKYPTIAIALWSEYADTNNPMWKKFPTVMLAKCAESQALRAGFSDELAGIYEQAEVSDGQHNARQWDDVQDSADLARRSPPEAPRDSGPVHNSRGATRDYDDRGRYSAVRETDDEFTQQRGGGENNAPAHEFFNRESKEHRILVTKAADKIYLATNKQACTGAWRNEYRDSILRDLEERQCRVYPCLPEEDIEKTNVELFITVAEHWDRTKPQATETVTTSPSAPKLKPSDTPQGSITNPETTKRVPKEKAARTTPAASQPDRIDYTQIPDPFGA